MKCRALALHKNVALIRQNTVLNERWSIRALQSALSRLENEVVVFLNVTSASGLLGTPNKPSCWCFCEYSAPSYGIVWVECAKLALSLEC